jgi:hypothetical protein
MQNPKKYLSLDEIFDDKEFYLIEEKKKFIPVRTADERLISSFHEINTFYDKNNREPKPSLTNIQEQILYSRLKNLRKNKEKKLSLKNEDKYNLLSIQEKEINSIDDIFNDDALDILEDDSEGLFDFKHTPKDYERASSDFVAKRKPCKNFEKYESKFKEVQKDLANGKRQLLPFKEDNLYQGNFYVHNGILMLLEKIDLCQEEQSFSSGKRIRKDGRTRCIFENGTESNMLYRSVGKALYTNGRIVTQNIDRVNENFVENFSNITDEDKGAGYIYILKSKSSDERIIAIENLYKIGYSEIDVRERIKNADQEPTYLMAPVVIKGAWKCYNLNPQKLEQLLHNFFGKTCLNIDIFDLNGKRHTPREWFIVPLEIIERAIQLIISGKIINYKYDSSMDRIIDKV